MFIHPQREKSVKNLRRTLSKGRRQPSRVSNILCTTDNLHWEEEQNFNRQHCGRNLQEWPFFLPAQSVWCTISSRSVLSRSGQKGGFSMGRYNMSPREQVKSFRFSLYWSLFVKHFWAPLPNEILSSQNFTLLENKQCWGFDMNSPCESYCVHVESVSDENRMSELRN